MVELDRGNKHRRYFLTDGRDSVISVAKNDEEGLLETKISGFWSALIDRDLETYYTATKYIKGRYTKLMVLQMLPVDCVVRAYLTGSILELYQSGVREIGGVELPDGMLPNEKLPELIFTPAIVNEDGEHEILSIGEMARLIDNGIYIGNEHPVTAAINIKRNSLKVFRYCEEYAKLHGVIVADACFQYGITYNRTSSGTFPLFLGDDVITTKSSRLWVQQQYRAGCEMVRMKAAQACNMLAI